MQYLRFLAASTLLLSGYPGPLPGYPPTVVALQPTANEAAPVRVLAVPRDENGYGGFGSLVIDSSEQFDSFKKTLEGQAGWNDRAGFLRALDQARIDYEREALVLIRRGDGSSSLSVTLAAPRVRGDTLTCTVRITGSHSNRDVKYRCFAVAVDKRKISRVEVRVNEGWTGKLQETLVVRKR